MRDHFLDALRGLAVLWMIIFHFSYDMTILGFVNWDFSQGFWWMFPRVIAFTFLYCVGASLNYVHRPHVRWEQLKKRSLKIGLGALLVSIGTYFFFPNHWIFFGTLHCIFVGSLLGALLVNKRKLALGLMLAIIFLQYALGYGIQWVSSIIQKPSMDFIPIYPWFWAILLGIILNPFLARQSILQRQKYPRFLNWMGHHSLKIYLIHQPLIYGVLLAIRMLRS
jgi:uncharacterized membrane protein